MQTTIFSQSKPSPLAPLSHSRLNADKGARGENKIRSFFKHCEEHDVHKSGADIHGSYNNKEIAAEVMNWKRGYLNTHRFLNEITPNLLAFPNADKYIIIAGGYLPKRTHQLATAYGFKVIELPPEEQSPTWHHTLSGVIDTKQLQTQFKPLVVVSDEVLEALKAKYIGDYFTQLYLDVIYQSLVEGYSQPEDDGFYE